MKERSLTVASVALFLASASLMLIVSLIDPDEVKIAEIDRSMVGEFVSLEGAVGSPRTTGGNLFFTLLQGSNKIDVVEFGSDNRLSTGVEVRIKGEISSYKGQMEIIADDIRII